MHTTSGQADQLRGWRDLIRDHFVALDIEPAGSEVGGVVRTTELAHLRVATVASRAQRCRRTAALARRDGDAYLQVGLLMQGGAAVEQDGRRAVVGVGDYALYETDRPFTWDLHGDWQLLVLTWPRGLLAPGPGAGQRLTARAMDGQHGLTGIVARMLRDLVTAPPPMTAGGAFELAQEVADLVRTAAAEGVDASELPPAASDLLSQIDRYIAEHLADVDLDPGRIAAAHFISTRQLHRLFASRGTTVGHHIRATRLARCRHDLRSPRSAALSITHIATRGGFRDVAAFSRAFRSAYGISPSDYRALGTAGGR